jgi:acetolactate synthase small subunit
MTQGRITVLLDSELLTLGRTCGVLRRRNLPIRSFTVDSNDYPGVWRLSCVIDADEGTISGLVLQIRNVIGVRKATVTTNSGLEAS